MVVEAVESTELRMNTDSFRQANYSKDSSTESLVFIHVHLRAVAALAIIDSRAEIVMIALIANLLLVRTVVGPGAYQACAHSLDGLNCSLQSCLLITAGIRHRWCKPRRTAPLCLQHLTPAGCATQRRHNVCARLRRERTAGLWWESGLQVYPWTDDRACSRICELEYNS